MQEFDESESTVTLAVPGSDSVIETLAVPQRSWAALIDSYNKVNKRRFQLTPVQCEGILEHVKRGQPVKNVFKAYGVSIQKYTHWQARFNELEDRLEYLRSKPDLTELEGEEFHVIMRHPLRILLSDIERAEGIADLLMWERFNEMAERGATDMKAMQMKARFKEAFTEKQQDTGGFNVQINVGGNWVEEL